MSTAELPGRWKPSKKNAFLIPRVLRLVDFLRTPIVAAGIDHERFRRLLELRLVLDTRGATEAKDGFAAFGLLLYMAITWLTSLAAGAAAFAELSPELWMAIVAAHAMGMVGFVLLLMYAAMLVDTTDIAVLGYRPVPDRTLFAARLAHAGIYTVAVASMCTFWPILLGGFSYPFWSVLVAVPIVVALSAATALGLVALLFALVLRIFGPAQFQRVAFWTQVGASAFLMGGMQMVGPLLKSGGVIEWIRGTSWMRVLLPPLQQGGLYGLLLGRKEGLNLAFGAAAVGLPLVSIALAIWLASRHFIAGLQGEIVRTGSHSVSWRTSFLQRVGAWSTSTRDERAGYDFVLANGRRDKLFLRATLPLLMGFTMMGVAQTVAGSRLGLQMPGVVRVLPVYFLLVGSAGMLENVRFGESPDAVWVLQTTPLASLRRFAQGGIKALFLGTLAPLLVALVIWIVVWNGVSVLPDVALASMLVAAGCMGVVPMLLIRVPFSCTPKPGEADLRNLGVMMGLMVLGVLLGVVHTLARLHPVAFAVVGALALAAVVTAWRRLERIAEPVWK